MNSKTEDFDDTWVDPKHKKELLLTIKNMYENAYPWADHILLKCLVKEHFKTVIQNMNKEKYLQECEEQDDTEVMIENLI